MSGDGEPSSGDWSQCLETAGHRLGIGTNVWRCEPPSGDWGQCLETVNRCLGIGTNVCGRRAAVLALPSGDEARRSQTSSGSWESAYSWQLRTSSSGLVERLVEAVGIEPTSEKRVTKTSTCVSFHRKSH